MSKNSSLLKVHKSIFIIQIPTQIAPIHYHTKHSISTLPFLTIFFLVIPLISIPIFTHPRQNISNANRGTKMATVECLRGRLLAERANSKAAKEDADRLSTKLIELENQLKKEMKSRNKAEKRLKSLMKKLQSLNIFYVSDESETSSFLDTSEISSVLSTASSFTQQQEEDKQQDNKTINSTTCEIKEPKQKECTLMLEDMKQVVSSDQSNNSTSTEEDSSSLVSESSSKLKAYRNCHDSKTDDQSTKSSLENKEGNDQDSEVVLGNSMAIVLVDKQTITKPTTDLPISSASVKEVLDNLRNIRERIQTSLERRHMISVGSR